MAAVESAVPGEQADSQLEVAGVQYRSRLLVGTGGVQPVEASCVSA